MRLVHLPLLAQLEDNCLGSRLPPSCCCLECCRLGRPLGPKKRSKSALLSCPWRGRGPWWGRGGRPHCTIRAESDARVVLLSKALDANNANRGCRAFQTQPTAAKAAQAAQDAQAAQAVELDQPLLLHCVPICPLNGPQRVLVSIRATFVSSNGLRSIEDLRN